jgi:protein O-GlcNAc transferase
MTEANDEAGAALALHQQGRLDEAEAIYRRLLAADPGNAELLSLLGTLCHQSSRNDEAVDLLRRAVAINGNKASWYANLGLALRALGRFVEAEEALLAAIRLRPDYAEAHSNLGLVYRELDRMADAVECFRRAIALKPEMPGFYLNLGTTQLEADKLHEAEESFQQAVALNPRHVASYIHLGYTQRRLGRMEEAVETHEHALRLDPDNIDGLQKLLFEENYLGRGSPAEALESAKRYGAAMARKVTPGHAHDNSRDPERRLRVGFVSGDFRQHPVSRFFGHLVPLFDRSKVEVALYYANKRSDAVTERIQGDADVWRPISGIKDDAADDLIRGDGIDVLIDLSGHTGDARLGLFARRPAPVQASWLGYSGTTGLDAIDYIIADANVIPPGDEPYFVETPVRLADAYLCYDPPRLTTHLLPTPAKANGYVTFGTFNRLDKVSDRTVACWAKVLAATPGSKLLLKSMELDQSDVRAATERRFAAQGIGAERLLLQSWTSDYALHMQGYSQIDICLDPFPYTGTTTSCDALWMGVPTVTLEGDRFISRVGASLLRTVGLDDLVATDVESYVAIASGLAADRPRLEALHGSLRSRFLASPLCDAPRFTRNFEAALRGMWRAYCERASTA